jgi:hypothetical protein
MLKRDLKEAALAIGIVSNATQLPKMSAAELKGFIIKNATLEQAQKFRERFPGYFGLSCRDAESVYGFSLTTGQAEYLARHGRLIIVEHFVSKYTGFECDLYSPESLAALGKEDLACPDSPNWVNQSVLVQQFGWTRTMISKFLPAPKLEANPRYRSAPDMKLWRIEDIEAAMARDDFQEAAEKAKASRAAGRKGAETRRQKLAAEVDEKSRTSALSPWTKIASEKPPLQPSRTATTTLLPRGAEASTITLRPTVMRKPFAGGLSTTSATNSRTTIMTCITQRVARAAMNSMGGTAMLSSTRLRKPIPIMRRSASGRKNASGNEKSPWGL